MTQANSFNRNFNLMVVGQVISILGSAILRFALNLYILDLTGRADVFAFVMAISYVPYFFSAPIGGAIADRFNRRNLMVLFDFLSSAIVFILVFFLFADALSVSLITVVLACLSAISAMYQPAVQASIPVLVHQTQLEQANGIVSGVGALSGILGPVLGGALYAITGLGNLLLFSGIAFAASAVMEIFIHIPFEKLQRSGSMIVTIFKDLKTGLKYMVQQKPVILKIVFLAAGLNLFLSSFLIVGAPYVLRITMNSTDTMYTIGMTIAEVATIAGALSVGFFSKKMKLQTLYQWLFIISTMLIPMSVAVTNGMLGLGYLPSFILFFLFAFLIMMLATVISVYVIAQVQRETPNDLLGKIMAIIMAVSQCAAPLGQLLYGFLLQQFSSQTFIPVLIACAATAGLSLLAKKMLSTKQNAPQNSVTQRTADYE